MLPHWTQNDLTVNGARLHYYRTGDGSKPPLVLAHGFSDDGLCWQPTAHDLEAAYDVIMPDARGHGLSERVRPGESVDMAADLAEIIRLLGLDHPIVGGHSMGAMVAFQVGVRYPNRVRALILEDPPWWLPGQSEMRPIDSHQEHPMAGWVHTCVNSTTEQLIAQCRLENPTWPEIVVQTWCTAKKRMDPNILSILRIDGSDWQEKVKTLACPVLLITADVARGGIITPQVAAQVEAMNSQITIAHIPGTGHHIRFENYLVYMDAVRSFLEMIGEQKT
jgi:N-formylmaleamate deformylase